MEASGGDVAEFLRADREFHLSSYAGAPAGETAQIIGRMWNTTQHYRREFTKLAAGVGMGATHLEHRLLLDCIGRRDADDAERVLVMHIRRTRLALEQAPGDLRLASARPSCNCSQRRPGSCNCSADLTSAQLSVTVANDCNCCIDPQARTGSHQRRTHGRRPHADHRMDRYWANGLPAGPASADRRLRRGRLQPDAVQVRASRRASAPRSSTARSTSPTGTSSASWSRPTRTSSR